MACAPADERFDALKKISVPEHALPRDLLADAKTVVVWFIPFKKYIQMDNTCGDPPELSWGRAYVATNDLINRCGNAMKEIIEKNRGNAQF